MKRAFVAIALAVTAFGCGSEGTTIEQFGAEETQPIARRPGFVVMEGCALDTWQTSQLESSAAKRVIQQVILSCPEMRSNGEVAPTDPDARAALAAQVAAIQRMGYAVRLGVTLADDLGQPLSPARDVVFSDASWRASIISGIASLARGTDGVDIDVRRAPTMIRSSLSLFFRELSVVRASTGLNVGVLVPPSTMSPSDVQGGDAWDLSTIAPSVDRVRVMTLDFSCCGAGPGPGIDSGWAVDAARYAQSQAGRTPVDVAMPLYGTDFSSAGDRPVTYLEARAVADGVKATPARGPNGTLHFTWTDAAGVGHDTWFDDGVSTARVLHAWDTSTLPETTGIVFYGLGAEDPMLWDAIARGMP